MIIGSLLCSKNDWLKMPNQVLQTRDLLLTTPLGQKMRWLTYRAANTKKYTNLSLDKWHKNNIKALLNEERITTIIITDKLKSEDAINVVYNLDSVKNLAASGLVNKIEATFLFEKAIFQSYIDWMHAVGIALECVYGFIHGFNSESIPAINGYLMAMYPTNLLNGDGMRDWISWQKNQEYCNRYIRNTYWGNILSPSHLERLDGADQLRDRIEKEGGVIEQWNKNLIFIKKYYTGEEANLTNRVSSITSLVMPEEWVGFLN